MASPKTAVPTIRCGQCEATLASLHCHQCDEDFCESCASVVHSKGKLKLHKLHSMAGKAPLTSASIPVVPKCRDHPDEKLSMLCLTCRKVVCSQCLLVGTCKGHECGNLSKEFETLSHRIRMKGENLKVQQKKLAEAMRPVLGQIGTLEQQQGRMEESIRHSMDEIRRAVDAKEKQLLDSMKKQVNHRMQALVKQRDNLTTTAENYGERAAKAIESKKFTDVHEHCTVLLAIESSLDSAPKYPGAADFTPVAQADLSLVVTPAPAVAAIQRLELENDDSLKRRTVSFFSNTVGSIFQGAWPSDQGGAGGASTSQTDGQTGAGTGTSPVGGDDSLTDEPTEVGEISAPIAGTFKHESHVGFDPDTGAFVVRGIPPEWEELIGAVDSRARGNGESGLQQEEVEYLVGVLQSIDEPKPFEVIEYVVAAFDFSALEPGDLSFKCNDVLAVHKKDDSGWWHGSIWLGGKLGDSGVFPANYVTAQTEQQPQHAAVPSASSEASNNNNNNNKGGKGTKPGADAGPAIAGPAAPPSPASAAPTAIPARNDDLLASIRSGRTLRKTSDAKKQSGASQNNTVDQLVKALSRLRQAVDGQDDEDDDDDGEDEEEAK